MRARPTALSCDARVIVLWGFAVAACALTALAPVRPWGWAGWGLLPSAGLGVYGAWSASGGPPPRRLVPGVAVAAAAGVALIRWALPWLLGWPGA